MAQNYCVLTISAIGTFMATQIAAGEENDVKIRFYGDKGCLQWKQMEPNSLILKAFANICRNFSLTLRAKANDLVSAAEILDFPGVEDGILGMQFIDTFVCAGYNDVVKRVRFGKNSISIEVSPLLF